MRERTIAKSVEFIGIGLHKGLPVRMRLEPAEERSGIVFYRRDRNRYIKVRPQSVVDTRMATVIGEGGVTVSTIEHFMSTLYSYGIDNLLVILDSDEVPVMDGSAIAYSMLLDEAGIQEQRVSKRVLKIRDRVRVQEGEKYVELLPSKEMIFDFTIDFDHPAIGREHYRFNFTKQAFLKEIAKARTFGFLKEVQYLRSMGLAKGGSLDNAIVLDDYGILNPEGLRYPDEFVRHKILDAIGDLALLGMPIMGEYRAFAGSHALNHRLTLELLKEGAYDIVELDRDSTEEQRAIAYAFATG
ncbi:MAG: UDP-3-O-acyl-N-acetylglucosamine deacetylase [Epsilonproteobacteria bacterium]|nr:UDP-3-O-[3-hydroxymyristoyl] N-acetylglucosamine deacetylase [Campylobacterota bacterium]NPA56711.1 UDP-3-O-acyl-N-acetylglucosamine deacetylase [Campylobacterota bacterium]